MLKKVSLVAVVAVAGALALSPLAFADDESGDGFGEQGQVFQDSVQDCEKNILSGAFSFPGDSENESDDDVDCDQELSPEEDD